MHTRAHAVSKRVSCLGLLLVVAGCATAPKEPLLTERQKELNVESFDHVWTTIRDKHFDPGHLEEVGWQAMYDDLRPRVEQATLMREARAPIREMLERLEQSHFGIIPAGVYVEMQQPGSEGPRNGVTGIDLRIIDGRAVVTSVADESPAAEAGVKPGWEIVRIGDAEIVPLIAALAPPLEDDTYRELMLATAVSSRLRGQIGRGVAVTFLTDNDEEIQLDISRVEQSGRWYVLGHLPPFYVEFESHLISDDIGYIHFNCFMDPVKVMPAFGEAIKSFADAKGIIIDVRGNPGGIGAMTMGMAGWLVAERDLYLGTLYTRDSDFKFIVNPRVGAYAGPVAVLVDGLSGSASEIFSGGLKGLGRARIFGSRTAGAALPAAVEKLPNGDGFMYALGNYVAAGGDVLEGNGVIPDVEVYPTREALLEGRDLALEAAIDWIHTQP